MKSRATARRSGLLLVAAVLLSPPASAQDLNVSLTVDSLVFLLADAPFELSTELTGTRFQGDRTSRVDLIFSDSTAVLTKWAPAPRGGEAFNNVPRYEVAAFEVSRLILPEQRCIFSP